MSLKISLKRSILNPLKKKKTGVMRTTELVRVIFLEIEKINILYYT